jgi:hypothetical protein
LTSEEDLDLQKCDSLPWGQWLSTFRRIAVSSSSHAKPSTDTSAYNRRSPNVNCRSRSVLVLLQSLSKRASFWLHLPAVTPPMLRSFFLITFNISCTYTRPMWDCSHRLQTVSFTAVRGSMLRCYSGLSVTQNFSYTHNAGRN